MKKIILFFIFILIISGLYAQNLRLFKDDQTGKYGFKDATGKIVVAPVYDTTQPFINKLTIVSKRVAGNLYWSGLINDTGTLIFPERIQRLYIKKGFIVVLASERAGETNKYGFMDRTGKLITALKYETVDIDDPDLAKVSIGEGFGNESKIVYGCVDKAGKEVIPVQYETIFSGANGMFFADRDEQSFILDKTGKETPLSFKIRSYPHFGKILIRQNNKYGFVNTKAEIVIPLKYDRAGPFSEGKRNGYLSAVTIGKKQGFIDTLGKEVVPVKYDMVRSFSDGLAAVSMNTTDAGSITSRKWGYADSTGNLVIPMMNYDNAYDFSEGLAAVSNWDGKNHITGYIDKTGKQVIPLEFESGVEFSEGLAPVKKNGKYGYIDRTGRVVIPFNFESASGFRNGKALVKLGTRNSSHYINKAGQEIR